MKNKKLLFVLAAGILSLSFSVVGCANTPVIDDGGDNNDGDNGDGDNNGGDGDKTYTPDLSEKVGLNLSVNYKQGMGLTYSEDTNYTTPSGKVIKKGDLKPVWQTFQTKMNMTVTDVTTTTDSATNDFKANWETTKCNNADIACGNVADIVDDSVKQNTILNINDYLDKLPNFSAFLKENPIVSQSIKTAKYGDANKAGIYYFPYFDGMSDLEKMTLLRADYVTKLLDGTFTESDWDTDASILGEIAYQPTVSDSSYDVKVASALNSTTTKIIKKASATNIIKQQNDLAATDRTSAKMVKQFRDYIDARYGTQYAKRSDLFLGVDASYDADEMVALMRLVRISPRGLTGNSSIEMVPFVPREYNNQRIADLYRWAGQMWGVRGVESRCSYLYIDSQGKIHDARGDQQVVNMLSNLNSLYKEGLILKDFEKKSNYGITNGKYAEAIVVGGNAKYSGFMEYDYAQTQGVWNSKAGSTAIDGYNFRPVIANVGKWDGTNYFQFTESWRSVKTQAWCLNASLAETGNEKKLLRALALCDYLYSDEGQQINSFGSADDGYTSGTMNYMGRNIAKFTDSALTQLNDTAIGKGSYTDYLRKFVGATMPIGYVKEQGMEYQCTNDKARAGLEIINTALTAGTYKHTENKDMTDGFYKNSPSSYFLSQAQVTQKNTLETKSTFGAINSNSSTSEYSPWDDYVIYGFGGTKGDVTLKTGEGYLTEVNTTWNLPAYVKLYQDAYTIMTE